MNYGNIPFFSVIKSDFVNGIFGLSANDCSIVSSEAESVYLIEVERQHSFVGRVKLYWEILDGNGQLSTSQFVTANGSVEFNEYEKHKVIVDLLFSGYCGYCLI